MIPGREEFHTYAFNSKIGTAHEYFMNHLKVGRVSGMENTKLSKVRQASGVMWMGDSQYANDTYAPVGSSVDAYHMGIEPGVDNISADRYPANYGWPFAVGNTTDTSVLTTVLMTRVMRHTGQNANYAFADGHVATVGLAKMLNMLTPRPNLFETAFWNPGLAF